MYLSKPWQSFALYWHPGLFEIIEDTSDAGELCVYEYDGNHTSVTLFSNWILVQTGLQALQIVSWASAILTCTRVFSRPDVTVAVGDCQCAIEP